MDSDNAKARFEDGTLELRMPKLTQARRRRIEVEWRRGVWTGGRLAAAGRAVDRTVQ